jgi:hypothetical protein
VPEVMDPNEIVAGARSYPTCGNAECDFLVLGWLEVDTFELNNARDAMRMETGNGGPKVSCVPLVVPSAGDMYCAACGVFVMHGAFCREIDADHPGLDRPHPDFANLI